ncbi:hypothetical protein G4B88_021840 [Cannabis sativa]|uniref:Reverse transcriptase zinc-binding domain-containing protein n=1 Tax=Cannabis sativa TaxID=3483 RepID=A0A7J6GYT9_CANSA|nr:hypothetical protein G4B88_021840 [Cannabis sativa]
MGQIVHSVYLQDIDWRKYSAPLQMAIKDVFRQLISQHHFQLEHFHIKKAYQLLCPQDGRVRWNNEIWNRFNSPKHSVIAWLAIQNRLKTRDKLLNFNILQDLTCLLCGLFKSDDSWKGFHTNRESTKDFVNEVIIHSCLIDNIFIFSTTRYDV